MKFQVGKCYSVTLRGVTYKFRVIKNENNTKITVRLCQSNDELDLLTDILTGDISDIQYIEFNCEECDGKPSL